jgi:aminoglycoside phosphotransferase (APT) family kinase protein
MASALSTLGVHARSARIITGVPSRVSARATVRVTLTDGRIVKVRRFRRLANAKRYRRLVPSIRHLPLPAILFSRGRITVEEWIEGTTLADLRPTRKRLRAAADILGTLHAIDKLGHRRRIALAPTRAFVAGVKRRITSLATARALLRGEAEILREAVGRLAPATAPTGLIHHDFCAENIVENRRGRLYVIDNVGIDLGFLDFDLARTWYRWPMPDAWWRIFLAQYATWRPAPLTAGAPFWRIAAVVRSARFRLTQRSPEVATPLRRLRLLIEELRR